MSDDRTYKVGLELAVRGSAVAGVGKAAKAVKGAAATMTSSLEHQKAITFDSMRALSSFTGQVRSSASTVEGLGRSMASSAMSTAAAYAGMAAKVGMGGFAAAAGLAAAKGFQLNVAMESSRNAIAGTLQLFNHSVGATNQLGANIKVAEAALQRLNTIANKSPGELADVQALFQNMLPGARSITGSMERILSLTQKTAMMTPVFGGDFKLVGSQMSRMLTGGAGAEMETWKTIQKVVLDVGQEMNKTGSTSEKIFDSSMQMGEKLTMAFNKLSGEDRLRLLEGAFSRAGPEMEKMFAESWDGASSTFKSGWKQIAQAGTRPLYESLKAALIKANSDGGVFSEEAVARMKDAAESIGLHFAKMGERAFDLIGRGIVYLDQNWQKIANSIYHGFQYGAVAIKAAFAFGFAKMVAGSAIVAAASGARAAGAVGRGVVGAGKAGFALGRGAVGAAKGAMGLASMVKDFFSFKALGGALKMAASGAAMLTIGLLPIAAIAIAAGAALGTLMVSVAAIGAYIASEWDNIMSSMKQGFEEGTLTIKPLVEQALLLWERLKLLGGAIIGNKSGADMAKTSIDLATGAVQLLSNAVVTLGHLAADFFDFVADLANTMSGEWTSKEADDLRKAAGLGPSASAKIEEAAKVLFVHGGEAGVAAARALRAASGTIRADAGSAWSNRSDRMREALKVVEGMSVKDLSFDQVDRYTQELEDKIKGVKEETQPPPEKVKGPRVSIGTFNYMADLRNEDPDRAMVGLVNRLEKAARSPTGSVFSIGGM